MEKWKFSSTGMVGAIGFLGVLSVVTSIAAEFTKNRVGDVRLDAKFCSLPKSPSFGLGITATLCLLVAQIVGFMPMAAGRCFQRHKKFRLVDHKKKAMAVGLVVFSWACLALAIVLLGVGSSMNQMQPYGSGWLDGKCYVVRPGVYTGSALLAMVALICTLAIHSSAITTYAEEGALEKRAEAMGSPEEGNAREQLHIEATINEQN